MMSTTPFITATKLLELEHDEKALWYIKDLLPTNSISIITGPSDCGKSTFAKHLALAVASGADAFLGYEINCSNRNVLYLSSEDNEITTVGRFRKQANGIGIDKCDNLSFCFGHENIAGALKNLEKVKPGLIILDTLSDLYTGNPNSWADIRNWLRDFRGITETYECTIIGIHHNVKNSEKSSPDKNKLNGSQAIEAVTRCLIEIRLGKGDLNEREMTILKNNFLSPDKKNKSVVLRMCPESSLFTVTSRISGTGGSLTHDAQKWIKRYFRINPDKAKSIDITISSLKEKYPEEHVPGKTWFSEKLKEDKIVVKEEVVAVYQS